MAQPPIALAEVQAYVYMAKVRMADVYEALGDHERAMRLRKEAAVLRDRLDEAFWLEDEQYFAYALDGNKAPVRTVVSNPGHLLYCDAVDWERAEKVARRLFQPDMFSGWGIRTMSKTAKAYNPMSYHNGSVWPHDNAMIGAGLKRYRQAGHLETLATALFEASLFFEGFRLPELFCGFHRVAGFGPTRYPVSCSPQAWAAAAPLELLRSLLGVEIDAPGHSLALDAPSLPPWPEWVELIGMRVGSARVDLRFRRGRTGASLEVLDKSGELELLVRR
jgi:glycogen debranching enzyme